MTMVLTPRLESLLADPSGKLCLGTTSATSILVVPLVHYLHLSAEQTVSVPGRMPAGSVVPQRWTVGMTALGVTYGLWLLPRSDVCFGSIAALPYAR